MLKSLGRLTRRAGVARPACKSCGQPLPLPKSDIGKMDALATLKAAIGGRRVESWSEDSKLSPSQAGAIRATAMAHGLSASEECKLALGCEPEYLSSFAASKFISYLNQLARERRETTRRTS